MAATQAASGITALFRRQNRCTPPRATNHHCSQGHKSLHGSAATLEMHRSTAHNYGALTASPSVFEENESCGDAYARQLPSLEWIKAYDLSWLWNDVAGGITLSSI